MRPLLSLVLLVAISSSAADTTSTFRFKDTGRHTYCGRSFDVLEDPNSKLSAQEALVSTDFKQFGSEVPNLGVSGSSFWVRSKLVNESAGDNIVLCLEYAEIDEVEAFLLRDGQLLPMGLVGHSITSEKRSSSDPEFAFDLPVRHGGEGTVLLRLKSNKQLQIPIVFRSAKELTANRGRRNLIIGVYIGIMLVLALYNLFIFTSIRDRSYLYYVLYLLVVSLTQLAFIGIGPFYMWAGNIWLSSYSTLILTLFTATLGMVFARQFIGTQHYTPKLHKWGPVFFVLFAGCIGLQQFGLPIIAYQVAQALSGWSALYTLAIAILAWKRGSRQAFFFLMAWTAFLIAVVVFVLKDLGVLPYNDITTYAMPVGSAIEGILLSFGLADRINVLRREKEASQAAALEASQENERIIREQNVMLEEKVQERTHALSETNEHLKRTQTQLVNSEKMASLGQLTAGIAHEINNPINFITSNIIPLRRNISEIVEVMQGYRLLQPENAVEQLKVLKAQEKKLGIAESIEELDDIIGSIAEGSSRTAEIVRGLRNFSRLDEDDLKESDLNEGIRSTLSLLSPQYRDKVTVDLQLGDIPLVECYPGKVNQVFMNILTNGVQATLARTDAITPRIVISSVVVGDEVVVSIKDNGVGMTEEVKAHMFDPFFTTKAVGEGTGLGLAIVYGIIQDHHGRITSESAVGLGSEFQIILPIRRARLNERRA